MHSDGGRLVVRLGGLDQPARDAREGDAVLWGCNEIAIDPGFRKPGVREIDAASISVFDDVAGDVGELEREPEIAGPLQGRIVADAHDAGHHEADDAGDAVAVGERVGDRRVTPACDIHGEAVEVIEGEAFGNGVAPHHLAEGGEDGIGRPAVESAARFGAQPCEPFSRVLNLVHRSRCKSQFLAVDDVVAVPAPGVEQHGIRPHPGREEPRRSGEAF
jgi:hypothetical protein